MYQKCFFDFLVHTFYLILAIPKGVPFGGERNGVKG